MRTNAILSLLVVACSSLSWLPLILEPSVDLPWYFPLAVIALGSCSASALWDGRWLLVPALSAAATLAGIVACVSLRPLEDGIAQSYMGIAALVAALAVAFVSFIAGLVGRRLAAAGEKHRHAFWLLLAAGVAFAPVVLAVRPSVIAHRVARNDRIAADRFQSLKTAVERTSRGPGGLANICDGHSLRNNYSGAPFSDQSWRYIAGNYVKEDGYLFGIVIDCSRPLRYGIDARPARRGSDGTRTFCADDTGRAGCRTEWNRSPNDCVPCE